MENKKQSQAVIKGKINIIDFLIVVFVLITAAALVLVGIVLINDAKKDVVKIEQTEGYLTYTVVIYNLSDEDADKILALTDADAIYNALDHLVERNCRISAPYHTCGHRRA